jgi:8-oxo-dGTP pyrophosphatase MutT (NUDIX family)
MNAERRTRERRTKNPERRTAVLSLPRPASTVILLRDSANGPEVFLVRRHDRTPFMGGAHVFPGGAVDPGDRDIDGSWCSGDAPACAGSDEVPAAAFHVAGLRELFEEAGILLARDVDGALIAPHEIDPDRLTRMRAAVHARQTTLRDAIAREGLRLALDALTLSAHWVTPPVRDGRRFDTRFFVARVPEGQEATHDAHETNESVWLTPAGGMAAAARNEIVLPPPTWTSLREIDALPSVDAILAWARQRQVERREPEIVEAGGVRMLVMPGDPRHSLRDVPPSVPETCFVWYGDRWHPEAVDTRGGA